jgi:hypothetical protein
LSTQNLFIDQFVVVSAAGADENGKVAAIAGMSVSVDDHAIVYAVTSIDSTAVAVDSVLIAAKGVEGTAVLTINATDAAGVALPAQTVTFNVTAKPAVVLNLTVGTPATIDANTPTQPVGW